MSSDPPLLVCHSHNPPHSMHIVVCCPRCSTGPPASFPIPQCLSSIVDIKDSTFCLCFTGHRGGSPTAADCTIAHAGDLLEAVQQLFRPGSAYWRAHGDQSPETPFFSYLYPLVRVDAKPDAHGVHAILAPTGYQMHVPCSSPRASARAPQSGCPMGVLFQCCRLAVPLQPQHHFQMHAHGSQRAASPAAGRFSKVVSRGLSKTLLSSSPDNQPQTLIEHAVAWTDT